jgi:GrpB-like predicted nucleotidyltransferase (UPF0157 family)
VIAAGHHRWADQLAFRDALRRDDELAGRYADLKRRLAAEHAADREAYTEAKGEFVRAVLGRDPRDSPELGPAHGATEN